MVRCNVTIFLSKQRRLLRKEAAMNHLFFDGINQRRRCDMEKITWEIQYLSFPPVLKYCKKCCKKSKFICSKKFRVNAQGKALDIWLIYNCLECDTPWNARVYFHISPQLLNPVQLEGFQKNSLPLVEKYAMDNDFLYKNGADEVKVPPYSIIGSTFLPSENVALEIKSRYTFPVKVSTLVRKKLHLSQTAYLRLIENGNMAGIPRQDLRKCKLKNSIVLIFQS